ncbi:ImmA/IrrE family metallo-endopeptidase [Candidatus Binatus sp.]|uniref:ImmA/IrrE family metallo-endopeptidase n=1 Tax=Candidatus Binatus sp. TaxID=2811406 RepID=UPI003CAE5CA1
MKMIPDRTGRFQKSPHWEIRELEQMCEDTMTSFLRQHFGFERIPVPTEAVTMLIERDAADLDLATNLSDDIHEVFGFTQFERGRKPLVKIARELWEQRHRNNRLRTTLTHEYGHVMLHTWLYDKYGVARGPHRCYWQSLLPTERVFDWFEWQAGYASGALLMPESFARRTVEAYFQNRSERPPVAKESPEASVLCQRISLAFDVSVEAASVRLSQLGYLTQ